MYRDFLFPRKVCIFGVPYYHLMPKTLLILLAFGYLTSLSAQKTEFGASLYSGFLAFGGASAAASSFFNHADAYDVTYTNNPFGSKTGLGYGVSGCVQRVTSRNILLGFQLGYEDLRSKIDITRISGYTGSATYQYEAEGQTYLASSFVTLYPSIGYRFTLNQLHLDLTGGVDIGYCLSTKEKGEATASNGTTYTSSLGRETVKSDIRQRVQITTSYKKAGLFASYAWGLTNYKNGFAGGVNECYSRLLRLGVSYRLN